MKSGAEFEDFSQYVVFAHDGIDSVHTGAGMSNWRFIQSLIQLGHGNKLTVGSIHIDPRHHNYSVERSRTTQEYISNHKGVQTKLDNGTDGLESFGYIEHWHKASMSALRFICITKFVIQY